MGATVLREADRVEIVVLVDNYCDHLLGDGAHVRRLRAAPPAGPMAEHGLSVLLKVTAGGETHTVLVDGGISGRCLLHNAALLASTRACPAGEVTADPGRVETVVLSHGHYDHFGGLAAFIRGSGRKIPLVLHPAAFVERRKIAVGGDPVEMPPLEADSLAAAGALLDRRDGPSTVAAGLVFVSGEVERTTDFETGAPHLQARVDGRWVQDPFVDDQAVAVRVRGRGLVVIGGCCHAGVINTVNHVRGVTGVSRVHALLGGFHLSGSPRAVVDATVAAVKKIAPDVLVPMHCTGWRTIGRFAAEMPHCFILNAAGSAYLFGQRFPAKVE